MTTCDTWRTSLGAYVLGTLEPADQRAVEAHLATCPVCLAEVEELSAVMPSLASVSPADLDRPQPPAALFDRIAASVSEAEPAPASVRSLSTRRWRGRRAVLALAASVVVLAGAGTAVGVAVVHSHGPVTHSTVANGVRMSVRTNAVDDGTTLALTVSGLPAHEHCHLIARAADGTRHDAGSWDADYDGQAHLTEHTDVPRSQLRGLTLYGTDGKQLVDLDL